MQAMDTTGDAATSALSGGAAGAFVEEPLDDIHQLQNFSVMPTDIKRLAEAGHHTVTSVLMATRKDLLQVKGFSDAKLDKIIEACKKIKSIGFVTGNEVLRRRQQIIRLTTGSKDLDTLLGGGVESASITEVFGEFRTGKTQLCHTLCVTCQLPIEDGGGNGKVAYIDTEGTFRPERVEAIAQRFGLDPGAVLDNISVARAYTHEHQMQLLPELAARMADPDSIHRLLIIDSAMALFRVDFSGRGELSERQQKLGKFLSTLIKLAEQFNIAVVMTNQVQSDPGAGAVFVNDPKKPLGGHVMAHASTTRLFLRKGRGEERICKIFDSPSLAENETTFRLSEGGIADSA